MARNPNSRGQAGLQSDDQRYNLKNPAHPAYWADLESRLAQAQRLAPSHPRRRAIMASISGPMTPRNVQELRAKSQAESGRFAGMRGRRYGGAMPRVQRQSGFPA